MKRSEASSATIDLRKALNLTQQEFAHQLEVAISSVARWETKDPPKGDALLRLGEFAWKHKQTGLTSEFEKLFLKEVMPRLKDRRVFDNRAGLVLCGFKFGDREDELSAAAFLRRRADELEEEPDARAVSKTQS